jgi:hypothetical protein
MIEFFVRTYAHDDAWLMARMVLLPKKGDLSFSKNLRGICLLLQPVLGNGCPLIEFFRDALTFSVVSLQLGTIIQSNWVRITSSAEP